MTRSISKVIASLNIIGFLLLPTVVAYSSLAGTAATSPIVARELQFSGNAAWDHLETIMGFNPRYPGTVGINQTVEYMNSTLQAASPASIEFHDFSVAGVPCRNVITRWRPAGEVPPSIIVIASHHDSRARADHDPDPAKRNEPVPAANDGGSSTVALLELARVIDWLYNGSGIEVSVETWLVSFDAEDQGSGGMSGFGWIEGSTALAGDLEFFLEPGQNISLFLLLDMIGGTTFKADVELYSDQALLAEFFAIGSCLGYGHHFPVTGTRRAVIDDHVPFRNLGIPALAIIDLDYPEWHTTADDLDAVSKDTIQAVGRVAETFYLSKAAPGVEWELTDPATGCTWTRDGCRPSPWFLLYSFLATWWPVLLLICVGAITTALFTAKKVRSRPRTSPGPP